MTCGGGIRSRSRFCLNGAEGELGCVGPTIEEEVCEDQVRKILVEQN